MKIIGRIIWWDEKYGRGAIESSDGREFIFDSSCFDGKRISRRSIGKIVSFQQDRKIKQSLIAKQVELVSARDLNSSQEKQFKALRDIAA